MGTDNIENMSQEDFENVQKAGTSSALGQTQYTLQKPSKKYKIDGIKKIKNAYSPSVSPGIKNKSLKFRKVSNNDAARMI